MFQRIHFWKFVPVWTGLVLSVFSSFAQASTGGNNGGYSGPQTTGQAIPIQLDHALTQYEVNRRVFKCIFSPQSTQEISYIGGIDWRVTMRIALAGIEDQGPRFYSAKGLNTKFGFLGKLLPQIAKENHFSLAGYQSNPTNSYWPWSPTEAVRVGGHQFLMGISVAPGWNDKTGKYSADEIDWEMSPSLNMDNDRVVWTFADIKNRITLLKGYQTKSTWYDANGAAHESTVITRLALPEMSGQTRFTMINAATRRITPYSYDFQDLYSCLLDQFQK